MPEAKPGDSKAIRLELSVPCDTRFQQVLTAMSRKMATYLGYDDPEASEVAETITRATGVFGEDGTCAYETLDVTFATSDQDMEIRVRYVCADATRTAPNVEQLLSQGGAVDAPLALMRRAMHTVEFGDDHGVACCTLTKRLPDPD